MGLEVGIYSGLAGALVMFIFMEVVTHAKITNADMVRAVGSMITRRYENALLVGLILHVLLGTIFGLLYCHVLSHMQAESLGINLAIGGFGGFVHGLIISYIILIEGQNRHPLERYQSAGFEVAVGHVSGHIVYGICVAYTYSSLMLSPQALSLEYLIESPAAIYFGVALLLMAFGAIVSSVLNIWTQIHKKGAIEEK